MEEIELRADSPVVACPRELDPLEVRVEIRLRVEGGAVDARELPVRRVAAPVRAGEAGQLQRLDRLRILQVRAAAEIGELALRIERDVALGGVDELDLVRVVGEELARFVARDLTALPAAAFLQLTPDLLLDPLEILLPDRLGEVEVVVEAVLDRRADRELHARIEMRDGLGQQMRRRVAQHGQRVGVARVARRQELDRITVVQWEAQVLHASVGANQNCLLGELRPDRARGVEPRGAGGKFEL